MRSLAAVCISIGTVVAIFPTAAVAQRGPTPGGGQDGGATSEARTVFNLSEATIADIQKAFASGALTAERLTEMYLARIEAYDQQGPEINAFLYINPNALEDARRLDREREERGVRGPMHGIPVVLKDVFDTYDMPTTGGFAPLKGVKPTKDAFVVKKLREAGAVILGKTNQFDWYANLDTVTARGTYGHTAMSTLGGYTRNPYDLERIPGWSSSGTVAAIAAWFTQVGLGSETGFSNRTPTSDTNLYGISTTSGLISRDGQMWSYVTGERGGPMARSMYDLCVTLDVIAGFDSFDLWTARSLGKMPSEPYVSFIDPNGLEGARVGVLEEAFEFLPITEDGLEIARRAIDVFKENGARVFYVSLGIDLMRSIDGGFLSSFERGHAIEHYVARQGPDYPFKNARDLLLADPDLAEPKERSLRLVENPVDLDHDPAYRAAVLAREALRDAVIELMDRFDLEALIYPHKLHGPLKIGPAVTGLSNVRRHLDQGGSPDVAYVPNQLSPITGLPAMIVPGGFTGEGLPIGFEILGRPWSEPTLIKLASGFEAHTNNQERPTTTPPLPGEEIEY